MPFEARDIARLRNRTTRSISPENFDGAKAGGGRATEGTGANAGRELGVGWKISPSVIISAGTTFPMATIDGPGTITHVWLTTHSNNWRTLVFGRTGTTRPSRQLRFRSATYSPAAGADSLRSAPA